MKGTIEQIWENESKNGQQYLTVQIDGERYSVWDTKYFDQLHEGAEIEYQFRQSGNFRNITEVSNPAQSEQQREQQSHLLAGNLLGHLEAGLASFGEDIRLHRLIPQRRHPPQFGAV